MRRDVARRRWPRPVVATALVLPARPARAPIRWATSPSTPTPASSSVPTRSASTTCSTWPSCPPSRPCSGSTRDGDGAAERRRDRPPTARPSARRWRGGWRSRSASEPVAAGCSRGGPVRLLPGQGGLRDAPPGVPLRGAGPARRRRPASLRRTATSPIASAGGRSPLERATAPPSPAARRATHERRRTGCSPTRPTGDPRCASSRVDAEVRAGRTGPGCGPASSDRAGPGASSAAGPGRRSPDVVVPAHAWATATSPSAWPRSPSSSPSSSAGSTPWRPGTARR